MSTLSLSSSFVILWDGVALPVATKETPPRFWLVEVKKKAFLIADSQSHQETIDFSFFGLESSCFRSSITP